MGSRGSGYESGGSGGSGDDRFSQERKDNAVWTEDKQKVDDLLRSITGQIWKDLSDEQKEILFSYTESSYEINSALGHSDKSSPYINKLVDEITSIIDKSELPQDMWLQRGIRKGVANKMFGEGFSVESIQAMIDKGQIIENLPFISTSGVKGGGFDDLNVILNIYAPKGTKALYSEPFSDYGEGDKVSWDGESKQMYFGQEFEVLIQRGAQFRPMKVTESNGKIYVDLDVLGTYNG